MVGGKPTRTPLKLEKDRKQGKALLDAVAEAMPQYPLDEAFAGTIPSELHSIWKDWMKSRG